MVDYGIYVLGKSYVTLSGGKDLDGVTQGDGSHLVGETLTISEPAWHEVSVTDDDFAFSDNDHSQRLDGEQSIDDVMRADGSTLEAEYEFTVTDGDRTWTIIGFNVNNTDPAYSSVEGLAFVGDPGDFPPVGTPLTITEARDYPEYLVEDYVTPICFASGTLIETPEGPRRVEDLRPGDCVTTLRDGAQSIRWHGHRTFAATGARAPIHFAPGAIGNARALRVSPQHRMLVTGWRADLLFGEDEVLIAAKDFVNDTTVRRQSGGFVTYHHLLFDTHQIVFAEGVPAESLHPGATAMDSLDRAARDEVLSMFPELAADPAAYGAPAAARLRSFEARALLSF